MSRQLIQTIIVLSVGIMAAVACTCPAMSFKERYYSESTFSVVKARVTEVSNPCLKRPGGICASPIDNGKVRLFKLKLMETFKGCGPMSSVFYAISKVGACGEFLQVDHDYLLNLPAPTVEKSEKTGYRELYKLTTCQENTLWDRTTASHSFLAASAKEFVFKCDHIGA